MAIPVFFILCLIAVVQCIPYEVVYRGKGCECPRKLGYEINIPKPPKLPTYTPAEYGYKIEVPSTAKAKVRYSFDFTVEEPKIPKPPSEPKLNLYAKVDRVTINKEKDCIPPPLPSPPAYAYQPSYGEYEDDKPLCGYVYNTVSPCKCNRPQCQCHLQRVPDVFTNVIYATSPLMRLSLPTSVETGNIMRRHKRDLRSAFFRPRKVEGQRPGRFIKMYHKSLTDPKAGALDIPSLGDTPLSNSKRKTKKVNFPRLRTRLVKRDIKGEYDLLEKERDDLDLTLPEIIQYMPETLQPDFKRGQCLFGQTTCGQQHYSNGADSMQDMGADEPLNMIIKSESSEASAAGENKEEEENTEDAEPTEPTEQTPSESIHTTAATSTVFTKRNAANYNQPIQTKPAVSASPISMRRFYGLQSACHAQPKPTPQIPTELVWTSHAQARAAAMAKKTAPIPVPASRSRSPLPLPLASAPIPKPIRQSAYSAPKLATTPRLYLHDHLGHTYLERNDRLRLVSGRSTVPDPIGSDPTSLQYAGDLELPHIANDQRLDNAPYLGAPSRYPVQHISNAQLDQIITDIVYRHPDFIDATAHYGGGLVDPEPLQEQQTKEFLKKLIDGRLKIWFGEDEKHSRPSYLPSHTSTDTTYSEAYNPNDDYDLRLPTLFY